MPTRAIERGAQRTEGVCEIIAETYRLEEEIARGDRRSATTTARHIRSGARGINGLWQEAFDAGVSYAATYGKRAEG